MRVSTRPCRDDERASLSWHSEGPRGDIHPPPQTCRNAIIQLEVTRRVLLIRVRMYMTLCISLQLIVAKILTVQTQCADRPVELVVGVRDHARTGQSTLLPQCRETETYQDWLKTPSIDSCSHSPLGCWRDINSFMALSSGSL